MEKIIKDLKINYSIKGEGKNILLLHGWGCNLNIFNKITDNLSKSHCVFSIDLPGFGKSDEPKKSWNIDEYTNFVIEFIKEMNINEISFIGHSFGGRIIIKMFEKELPFKIDKIVLIDSAGIKQKKNSDDSLKVKSRKALKKVIFNKVTNKVLPGVLDKIKSNMGSEDYRKATPIMRDVLVKAVNEDLTNTLPKINVPTLLIWGTLDTATPIEDAYTMERLIPNAGLVELKGRTHYSFLEEPITVNKVLDSFFGGK